jgi:hypothetical protein
MKPVVHAQLSVRKYGGTIDDYLGIHEWFDQTKMCFPDMRHRAILHSSFGIYLSTDKFGDYFQNSEGRTIATRDIGEEHVIQDMGRIPTLDDYLDGMPFYPWLGGPVKKITTLSLVD